MDNKILYENYLKDSGEILTEAEWILNEKRYSGKMRKFESYWEKLKRYGVVGLAAYITGVAASSLTGGLLGVPIGFVLYAGYRKNTDICKAQCNNDRLCFNRCYLNACKPVINQIAQEINNVKKYNKIDPEEKRKMLIKLNKELNKWVKRYNKYKHKIKKIVNDEMESTKKIASNSSKNRARYYGGE